MCNRPLRNRSKRSAMLKRTTVLMLLCLPIALSGCFGRSGKIPPVSCPAIPDGFLQQTEYPERPGIGATNRDIDIYAKRLEHALWRCNRDKHDLNEWKEGNADAAEDD